MSDSVLSQGRPGATRRGGGRRVLPGGRRGPADTLISDGSPDLRQTPQSQTRSHTDTSVSDRHPSLRPPDLRQDTLISDRHPNLRQTPPSQTDTPVSDRHPDCRQTSRSQTDTPISDRHPGLRQPPSLTPRPHTPGRGEDCPKPSHRQSPRKWRDSCQFPLLFSRPRSLCV